MTSSAPSVVSKKVSLGDLELLVSYKGEGPPVVVLHGGPGADHTSLLPQFDALVRGRQLIYYDQRGCGRSNVTSKTQLDWHHVADLQKLLEHLEIGQADLLGYSWGALLALGLVSPAPTTAAKRKVFEDRFAQRLDSPWARTRRIVIEKSDLRHTDPTAFRQQAFELSIAPCYREPEHAVGSRQFLISARVREAVWRSLGEYDLTHELTGLDKPTLVMHCRHDPIPLEAAEQIAALKNAEFEIFENSEHLPHGEEYERFVKTLDGFLPRSRA